MSKVIDLDGVLLSPATVDAWRELAARAAIGLRNIEARDIPDEQVRVNDDGTLTIFVKVPDVIDISMDVPADQWAYRQ